ncbi:MAG TPA: hypothetical protein GX522_05140 [Firmicutes bacterium]|nr:hypothetical protein [Bacillota bacterium]
MYTNAEDILPRELLLQIQEYVQGKEIYIPRSEGKKLGWGERNGARMELKKRNREIFKRYQSGASIEDLMNEFHLSYDSIRKIIYSNRNK